MTKRQKERKGGRYTPPKRTKLASSGLGGMRPSSQPVVSSRSSAQTRRPLVPLSRPTSLWVPRGHRVPRGLKDRKG